MRNDETSVTLQELFNYMTTGDFKMVDKMSKKTERKDMAKTPMVKAVKLDKVAQKVKTNSDSKKKK